MNIILLVFLGLARFKTLLKEQYFELKFGHNVSKLS